MIAADGALERVRQMGKSASIRDLLAVALSRRESDVPHFEEIADQLIKQAGVPRNISSLSPAEIKEKSCLDPFEVLRLLSAIHLGEKLESLGPGKAPQLDDPESVFALLSDLRAEKQEHIVVLLVDSQNNFMRRQTVHSGTLTMALVGAREVFRVAVRDGASSIIVAHNHPSGDPKPSPEDIDITKKLVEAGEMLDIPVLDHIIVGDGRFVSLRREGVIR